MSLLICFLGDNKNLLGNGGWDGFIWRIQAIPCCLSTFLISSILRSITSLSSASFPMWILQSLPWATWVAYSPSFSLMPRIQPQKKKVNEKCVLTEPNPLHAQGFISCILDLSTPSGQVAQVRLSLCIMNTHDCSQLCLYRFSPLHHMGHSCLLTPMCLSQMQFITKKTWMVEM